MSAVRVQAGPPPTQSATQWPARLRDLWAHITAPHPSITEAGDAGRARLTVSLMLTLTLMAIIFLLIGALSRTLSPISVLSVAISGAAYAASRTRRYELTAMIALLLIILLITAGAASPQSSVVGPAFSMNYVVIMSLLASAIFPLRKLLLIMGFGLLSILALPILAPGSPTSRRIISGCCCSFTSSGLWLSWSQRFTAMPSRAQVSRAFEQRLTKPKKTA